MDGLKFSILIPSIPERFAEMVILYTKLQRLIENYQNEVEILILIDNKKRSIGEKRNDLVRLAKGDYLAFVDDDDDISEDYIEEIIKGCDSGCDIITFKQHATISGKEGIIDFSLNNENEQFVADAITYRKPFHVCGIRSEIAKRENFPSVGYGEDWHWMERILKNVFTEYKIDKILHFYTYDENITQAPIEPNEIWQPKDQ